MKYKINFRQIIINTFYIAISWILFNSLPSHATELHIKAEDWPSFVTPYEKVNITINVKVTNSKEDGPWETILSLYDEDVIKDDLIKSVRVNLKKQNTWYGYTFKDITLSQFSDLTESNIELYAYAKIDCHDLNPFNDPSAQTSVSFVKIDEDDSYEPNNDIYSAKELVPGKHTQLKCYDNDWYKLHAIKNQSLNVELIFDWEDGEVFFELYNSLNQIIARPSDNSKYVSTIINQDGYYFIKIFGSKINYELSVHFDDIYEENDTFDQASLILSKSYHGLIYQNPDWYKVHLYRGNVELNISFTSYSENYLTIYDNSKVLLENSKNNSINYDIEQSGLYWISIIAQTNNVCQYDLEIKNKSNQIIPTPMDGSQNILLDSSLSWNILNSDIHPESVDIYFGKENLPPEVESQHQSIIYHPGILDSLTSYYWFIVINDTNGNQIFSNTWTFISQKNTDQYQCNWMDFPDIETQGTIVGNENVFEIDRFDDVPAYINFQSAIGHENSFYQAEEYIARYLNHLFNSEYTETKIVENVNKQGFKGIDFYPNYEMSPPARIILFFN
ncbi:secreted protein [Candidatus Magnetomorum sp. HK-1]|nr:secreted protein [Candidatus Magnetomorum sp. HK-1]